MRAAKIDFFLNPGTQLVARAEAVLAIERIVRASLPPGLAGFCHAGSLADGTLTLYADNGAVAAKLKQLRTGLVQQLNSRGVIVSSIRIEVWVRKPIAAPRPARKNMSDRGLNSFRELESELPDSALRDAVRHLIGNIGKARRR